eukprot:TRINITY_DN14_c0_g1_i13.p1 TRINITY_DN14_c0_g1~~TRINITY_DN14_c0_g1_i13.p1  ORF type:complete len:408 (+),score=95.15 TRINITY_DN14_c0_g1_i13:43-1266(+)
MNTRVFLLPLLLLLCPEVQGSGGSCKSLGSSTTGGFSTNATSDDCWSLSLQDPSDLYLNVTYDFSSGGGLVVNTASAEFKIEGGSGYQYQLMPVPRDTTVNMRKNGNGWADVSWTYGTCDLSSSPGLVEVAKDSPVRCFFVSCDASEPRLTLSYVSGGPLSVDAMPTATLSSSNPRVTVENDARVSVEPEYPLGTEASFSWRCDADPKPQPEPEPQPNPEPEPDVTAEPTLPKPADPTPTPPSKRDVRVVFDVVSSDMEKTVTGGRNLMPVLEQIFGGAATCINVCRGNCLPCGGAAGHRTAVVAQQVGGTMALTVYLLVPSEMDNKEVLSTLRTNRARIENQVGDTVHDVTVSDLNDGSSSISTGVILGIVVGSVVVVTLAASLVYHFCLRKPRRVVDSQKEISEP